MKGLRAFVVQIFALAIFVAAMSTPADTSRSSTSGKSAASPTVEEARKFTDAAEKRLLDLWIKDGRAQWVHETYITDDTEQMAADADQAVATVTAELAAQARPFDKLKLPEDVARKLMLLRLSVSIPTPRDPALAAELTKINVSLDGDYGKGKWCPDGPSGKCLALGDIEPIIAHSRDPEELRRAWKGWHAIAPPMRQRYTRMVTLANQGARELGFADVGAMWRSNYDMTPDEFSAEVDRLWQ
jgi:peptidyl-dipeptidase A